MSFVFPGPPLGALVWLLSGLWSYFRRQRVPPIGLWNRWTVTLTQVSRCSTLRPRETKGWTEELCFPTAPHWWVRACDLGKNPAKGVWQSQTLRAELKSMFQSTLQSFKQSNQNQGSHAALKKVLNPSSPKSNGSSFPYISQLKIWGIWGKTHLETNCTNSLHSVPSNKNRKGKYWPLFLFELGKFQSLGLRLFAKDPLLTWVLAWEELRRTGCSASGAGPQGGWSVPEASIPLLPARSYHSGAASSSFPPYLLHPMPLPCLLSQAPSLQFNSKRHAWNSR